MCTCLIVILDGEAQTIYTTISNGNWNDASTWDANGVPPSTLPNTDSTFIYHQINLNSDINIRGFMFIDTSASLIGNSRDIDVGRGVSNQGNVVNYGYVKVDQLDIQPIGCNSSDIYPIFENYNILKILSPNRIGENCGAGALINRLGGKVYAADIHLDHRICNEDTIFVQYFLNHGGIVECCGKIITSYVEAREDGDGPAEFRCIDICDSTGTDPIISIDGSNFNGLADAYNNADDDEVIFDNDSTFMCGFDYQGNPDTSNCDPRAPDSIYASSYQICELAIGEVFSTDAINGVNAYRWTFPIGVIVNSGLDSLNINVNWGGNDGNVCVRAIASPFCKSPFKCQNTGLTNVPLKPPPIQIK